MTTGAAHTFRFIARSTDDTLWAAGETVELGEDDRAHVRVLRLKDGAAVELLDERTGAVWLAHVSGDAATLDAMLHVANPQQVVVHVWAGFSSGAQFDALVDGAAQAGVSSITPLAESARAAGRISQRSERLERIARAAAQQAKLNHVPRVNAPEQWESIASVAAPDNAVMLVPGDHTLLDRLAMGMGSCTLLVGGADGIPVAQLDALRAAKWVPASLGDSILRSELAAAVATAVVRMRA